METEILTAAILKAEQAARNVTDSALREKAFEVVLNRLLVTELGRDIEPRATRATGPAESRQSNQANYAFHREPKTLSQRILALQSEAFFREPKSIGNVREGLGARGWHYPVTTISGVLQGLIQKRKLRRERVREGQKTPWKYSNP